MTEKPLIMIIGVTASGKGTLAFELARQIEARILSIDSMKVYRRMDIGTAKPEPARRRQVPYHLIDVVQPSESFSVGRYLELADAAIEQIQSANQPVIAAGGTALYIKALLYGLFQGPDQDAEIREHLRRIIEKNGLGYLHDKLSYIDPDAAGRIHPNDAKRIIRALEVYELTGKPITKLQKQFDAEAARHNWQIIGLRRDKDTQSRRINLRVKIMMEKGLVEEVKSLLELPEGLSDQARAAIGYAEIIDYLQGKYDLEKAVELIKRNTRRLAKNQRTWFKTFKNVNWLDIEPDETPEQILERVKKLLNI